MKNNTTGNSMEIFFDLTLIFLLYTSTIMGFVNFKKLYDIKKSHEDLRNEFTELSITLVENFGDIDDKIVELSNQNDRSMLALRETLEPAKPMKSNNWDSFREAFKGPTRNDVN